jgi:hypothetical protein
LARVHARQGGDLVVIKTHPTPASPALADC